MVKEFKEKDIRPSSLEEGQREAIKQDMNWLKERASKFVNVNCPACDKNDSSIEFRIVPCFVLSSSIKATGA